MAKLGTLANCRWLRTLSFDLWNNNKIVSSLLTHRPDLHLSSFSKVIPSHLENCQEAQIKNAPFWAPPNVHQFISSFHFFLSIFLINVTWVINQDLIWSELQTTTSEFVFN